MRQFVTIVALLGVITCGSQVLGASRALERAANDALREVNRAQSAIERVNVQRRRAMESSPEWQEAVTRARAARINLNRARAEALAALESNSDYKAARLELWKLQESLAALEKPARVTPVQLAGQAALVCDKRSEVTRMEAEHLSGNPSLKQARYDLIDAEAMLAALRRAHSESVQSDPQWRAARTHYEQANTRLATIAKPPIRRPVTRSR